MYVRVSFRQTEADAEESAREGVLTKEHVDAALREIRLALLEADVNYKVAKDFIASVKEKPKVSKFGSS